MSSHYGDLGTIFWFAFVKGATNQVQARRIVLE